MVWYKKNINLENNSFKIYAHFENHVITLLILKDDSAWKIDVSESNSECTSFSDYNRTFKTYLAADHRDVEFIFVDGKLDINLLLRNEMKVSFFSRVLKQVNDGKQLEIFCDRIKQLGLIMQNGTNPLEYNFEIFKVDFAEAITQLVDQLYIEKTQFSKDLVENEKLCDDLKKENVNLSSRLDYILSKWNEEKHNLISGFVNILNEKKVYIQQLNDALIAFKKGNYLPSQSKHKSPTASDTSNAQNKSVGSDDESSGNENKKSKLVDDDLQYTEVYASELETVSGKNATDSNLHKVENNSDDETKNVFISSTSFATQDLLDNI